MEERSITKIGIGVMIFKAGKVLLGKRKGSHGAGEYASPGGSLDYMESFIDCARREVKEEVGIDIENIRFFCVGNLRQWAPKHFIHIGLAADWKSGEPQVMEPDKVESWDWYDPNDLPKPLFGTAPMFFEAYKTGRNFWDA